MRARRPRPRHAGLSLDPPSFFVVSSWVGPQTPAAGRHHRDPRGIPRTPLTVSLTDLSKLRSSLSWVNSTSAPRSRLALTSRRIFAASAQYAMCHAPPRYRQTGHLRQERIRPHEPLPSTRMSKLSAPGAPCSRSRVLSVTPSKPAVRATSVSAGQARFGAGTGNRTPDCSLRDTNDWAPCSPAEMQVRAEQNRASYPLVKDCGRGAVTGAHS